MNVADANEISKCIKYLRENIYCLEDFRQMFNQALTKYLYAINISYFPDQLGGWNIVLVSNRNLGIEGGIESQSSEFYIAGAIDALVETLTKFDPISIDYRPIAHGLINVIVTGNNSVTIKI